MAEWVLLTYRLPPEPSAARVFAWRRLRRLGAILVHDATWALPLNAFTREQFQWLAAEIEGLKGSARVWIASPFPAAADADLVRTLRDSADRAFAQIAAGARRGRPGAAALARRFRDACLCDYFGSPERERARAAVQAMVAPSRARSRRRTTR